MLWSTCVIFLTILWDPHLSLHACDIEVQVCILLATFSAPIPINERKIIYLLQILILKQETTQSHLEFELYQTIQDFHLPIYNLFCTNLYRSWDEHTH